MSINRKFFFDHVRQALYPGGMKQSVVAGHEAILDVWEEDMTGKDDRWLAYMLATAYFETGGKLAPVEENLNYSVQGMLKTFKGRISPELAKQIVGHPQQIANHAYANMIGNGNAASGDGWRFRGRGLLQITGRANYRTFGIEDTPDVALDLKMAMTMLFKGMTEGLFTGKKLDRYFNAKTEAWSGARAIINPTDKPDIVANHAKAYYAALSYTV
ncbi:putative chitinase [Rhizobium sp. RU20A]|uniref:hypothetical protein n=1 Tax=Rhizobium sp. RU20A TaxID=1907412 RepID=UPI000956042B|nr:hypothetical protein [Rhizobium sp. RU20A]SIR16069.1 putative chitinase [Rhizobium sp. RU20A]